MSKFIRISINIFHDLFERQKKIAQSYEGTNLLAKLCRCLHKKRTNHLRPTYGSAFRRLPKKKTNNDGPVAMNASKNSGR